MTIIAANKVAFIHYTLTDEDGQEIDSSRDGEPMPYLHGAENIVPGLERQLEGKAVGDRVKAIVPAAEGYGERSGMPGSGTMPSKASSGTGRGGMPPRPVPLDAFEGMVPEPGMPIVVENDEGDQLQLWVAAVGDDEVMLSSDHPLAGVDLHFEVEIVRIRDATKAEIEHGHAHAGDGHHHHH